MKKRLLVTLCSLLLSATWLSAYTGSATSSLASLGFEDVRVVEYGATVYASVEPTAYRGTFRGAGVAVETLGRLFPDATAVELAVTEYRQPQVAVHAKRAGEGWTVSVDHATSAVLSALSDTPAANRSAGRVDLTVYPMVSIDNHRFDVLCEYIVSLAPAIEMTLWRGSLLTLQPVFPVLTNVWQEQPDGFIHIGVAALRQQFCLTDRLKATLSGGFFLGGQLGGDLLVDYRAGKALTLGLQASFLGDAYAEDGGYHIDSPDRLSVLGRVGYYHAPTQIEAGLTGGRFLYGDYGVRLDLTRHLGDYAVGVFGILTGGEHNAGFHFAIPLGGRRQMRRGPFRLRLPEYFDWEYNMVSYYEYAEQRMGRQLETRPDVNHSAHYWQPAYVEQYLRAYLNKSYNDNGLR